MLSRIAVPLGGLLMGCALLVVIELSLRLLGVAEDAPLRDPFAGFSSAVSVFEPAVAPDGERVYTLSAARMNPQARDRGYEPQRSFSADPDEDLFRVFVVGGSSAQGVPYTTRHAFSNGLEERLRTMLPDRAIEVVNVALSGYASRRLLPVVRDLVQYSPDLLIVYMGHNEWAEQMYYQHLVGMDPRIFRLLEFVYGTRIYGAAAKLLDVTTPVTPEIEIDHQENAREMFAVLRKRVSGTDYPTPRELAYRDLLYTQNLRAMAATMASAGAQTMFLTLSQNFSDWPPAASRHRDGLSDEELRGWDALLVEANGLAEADCNAALAIYERALAIDDQHAELHFRIARCRHQRGEVSAAEHHYRQASDLDPIPHGAPTHFNEILRQTAEVGGHLFVDTYEVLARASGADLVGDDLFTDFAHPNLRAHQLIADAVAQALRDADLPAPRAEWQWERYSPPDLEAIYAADPELRIRELESWVFVCLVAPRDLCRARAHELASIDPTSQIAGWVLAAVKPLMPAETSVSEPASGPAP